MRKVPDFKRFVGNLEVVRLFLISLISLTVIAFVPLGLAEQLDPEKKLEELERQVKELREEITRMKSEQETDKAETKKTVGETPSEAAEKEKGALEYLAERVRIGGYGSFRYEATSEEELNNTFTFRRFILTADATPVENLRAYMELEFERLSEIEVEEHTEAVDGGLRLEQEIESTNGSEIALEQAWIQYDFAKEIGLRIGAILVPWGRFNIYHDDNLYDFNRRPIIDKQAPVLPVGVAWTELGAGFTGEVGDGLLNYQVYVMNGATLDGQIETIVASRDPSRDLLEVEGKLEFSQGSFAEDLDGGKAVSGRVAFSPFLGSEIAGSFYVGQYTPDFLDINKILAGVGVDFHLTLGRFDFEGEYLFANYGGAESVVRRFAEVVGDSSAETEGDETEDLEIEIEFEPSGLSKRRQGFWLSGMYHIPIPHVPVLGTRFSNPEIRLVGRYELIDIDDLFTEVEFEDGIIAAIETEDRTQQQFTLGIAYRPTPLIGFILNVEYSDLINGDALIFPADIPEDNIFAFTAGAVFGF